MASTRRLLLVRHGLPDYTYRGRGDELPGPSLSDTGREQIRQVIAPLRLFEPVAIHSSPLARARESAEIVAAELDLPVRIDSDLKEWHCTERMYQVSERGAHWLRSWLAGDEHCTAVFGHASPLLGLIRAALYLPHFSWWRGNEVDRLVMDTCDRFEMSMGALFEVVFEPKTVIARCRHHPEPRILHRTQRGGLVATLPRQNAGVECREVRRPNFGRLIGYRKT